MAPSLHHIVLSVPDAESLLSRWRIRAQFLLHCCSIELANLNLINRFVQPFFSFICGLHFVLIADSRDTGASEAADSFYYG